jgi:hypothetical protein
MAYKWQRTYPKRAKSKTMTRKGSTQIFSINSGLNTLASVSLLNKNS